MLDFDRLRHAQHASCYFAFGHRLMQSKGEDGSECGSATACVPLLDNDAFLANFLKRADRTLLRGRRTSDQENPDSLLSGFPAAFRGMVLTTRICLGARIPNNC